MIIKFLSTSITALSFLVFCMSSADGMQYEPDEETDRFRDGLKTCSALTGSVPRRVAESWSKQLNEFAEKFSGFQVINNHFSCNSCGKPGAEFVQELANNKYTPNTLLPVFKEEWDRTRTNCLFGYFFQCWDYTFYTLIIERHPDKVTALNYLQAEESMSGFFKIANLEDVKNPEEAHVVHYPDGGHYGIYRGNGIVESKWGHVHAIFRHKLWQIPENYGNKVKFQKVVFK